jgi:hypothetical protein
MSYDISDYVDVKTRIELFYKKFPEGSIQFEFMGIMPGNADFIWGIARAYRHPDDPRPFTGTCSELAKGSTNFTRGSELANLETSCIGRSVGSAGIGLGKSMASKQEVDGAKARQVTPAVIGIDRDASPPERTNTGQSSRTGYSTSLPFFIIALKFIFTFAVLFSA